MSQNLPTAPHVHLASTIPFPPLTYPKTKLSARDLSNYWTANLYFKARNGTYKRVPQIPNRYLDGEVGGMTVYYTSPYDGSKVTAFKPVSLPPIHYCETMANRIVYKGFRMLAGNAAQRTTGGVTKWNAICFRCYNAKNFGGDTGAPCSDSKVDSVALPSKACPGGIRTTIRFPTYVFPIKFHIPILRVINDSNP
jgi:hypothetical protein